MIKYINKSQNEDLRKLYIEYQKKRNPDYSFINFQALFVEMLENNYSQTEIAEKYGINARTVSRELEKLKGEEEYGTLYEMAKEFSDRKMKRKKFSSYENFLMENLLEKYKDLVHSKIGKYFIIGAEKEDIIQEGMIGLYKAVKNFDLEKQNTFKTFANICVERQLITAIKSSNRQKHMPLNSYLSLNMSAYENEEDSTELIETFKNNVVEDPLDTITKKEYYEEIQKVIHKNLSDFEEKVLDRFVQGESYEVIAKKLDTPVKSVDNAIQRIRKKAIKNLF